MFNQDFTGLAGAFRAGPTPISLVSVNSWVPARLGARMSKQKSDGQQASEDAAQAKKPDLPVTHAEDALKHPAPTGGR